MAQVSKVTIIPVIRRATKSVVGAYNCGGFQTFTGAETIFALPSGKSVTIEKWVPNSANSDGHRAPWVMACVIDEPTYKLRSHAGYAEWLTLQSMIDNTRYVMAQGLPNRVDVTPGTLLDVLSNKSVRYS